MTRTHASDISALTGLLEMANRIGHVYGSEQLCMLLYTLARRERPKNVVEIGTGLGVSTLWLGQALKENEQGKLWTIDDGSDWTDPDKMKAAISILLSASPFDQLNAELDYRAYMRRVVELFDLGEQVTLMEEFVDLNNEDYVENKRYPFMEEPIDYLFLDINRSPAYVIEALYFFLPYTAPCCSIFIDSASTSLASFLFLERLVEQMNRSKVPRRFLIGPPERTEALANIVARREFRLTHFVECVDRKQNGTALLKTEPVDFIPHPETAMKLL